MSFFSHREARGSHAKKHVLSQSTTTPLACTLVLASLNLLPVFGGGTAGLDEGATSERVKKICTHFGEVASLRVEVEIKV